MDAYSYENDPTAVVGRRVAAFLIDLLSAVVVGAVVLALFGLTKVITDDAGFAIEGDEGNINQFDPSQLILEVGNDVFVVDSMRFFWLGAALFLLFLWIFVQALTGRTLGKWVTGVRTIAPDGGNPGPVRSIVRTLAWIVDMLLIGPMLAASTAGHRRLGDLVGRTFVVDQEFAGTGITIEDGSARTRTVGDDEIDLREDSEPAPSRKDKKQAERDAEERLRVKAEADAKAATKIDATSGKESSRLTPKETPTIKAPEPIVAKASPERVAVPAAAAYGVGAAAAASATGPAWPNLADANPTEIAADSTGRVAQAATVAPPLTTPASTPPISTPPISTPPISTPSVAATSATSPASTAFPPTAFGSGSTPDSGASTTSDPTIRQRITPEPVAPASTPTPAVAEQPAQATQNESGEWEYEPTWDDARQTYILWDARRSEWLQWNESAGTWGPISQ